MVAKDHLSSFLLHYHSQKTWLHKYWNCHQARLPLHYKSVHLQSKKPGICHQHATERKVYYIKFTLKCIIIRFISQTLNDKTFFTYQKLYQMHSYLLELGWVTLLVLLELTHGYWDLTLGYNWLHLHCHNKVSTGLFNSPYQNWISCFSNICPNFTYPKIV